MQLCYYSCIFRADISRDMVDQVWIELEHQNHGPKKKKNPVTLKRIFHLEYICVYIYIACIYTSCKNSLEYMCLCVCMLHIYTHTCTGIYMYMCVYTCMYLDLEIWLLIQFDKMYLAVKTRGNTILCTRNSSVMSSLVWKR